MGDAGRLRLFDVSDPASPAELAEIDSLEEVGLSEEDFEPRRVQVPTPNCLVSGSAEADGLLYVACNHYGLWTFTAD